MSTYHYRPDVLAALAGHGVRPGPETDPALVRAFVRDLYKFQIRQLRDAVRRGTLPKPALATQVEALRDAYPVLALQPSQFLEPVP